MGRKIGGPREKLLAHGGERLSDAELIAILLGCGHRGSSAVELAAAVMDRSGGLAPLSRASPRELLGVLGIGEARATRLAAAFHIGRRAIEAPAGIDISIRCAADVYQRVRGRLSALRQEVFLVVALDSRNVVIDEIEVCRGGLNAVPVHPREVFRPLIREAAAAVVLVHNHPSGDPSPSPDDVALTERMREVGELVGIPVLDHVVVAAGGYRSIAEELGAMG
jgi:DNA repair protein RadC